MKTYKIELHYFLPFISISRYFSKSSEEHKCSHVSPLPKIMIFIL